MYLDRPVVTSNHDLRKFNKLHVDSRLIGRLYDDRFAMVADSLLVLR